MLSKKTKYGIKALMYICRHSQGTPIPMAEIAKAENIPHKFLEAILLALRKGGILSAKKGKEGGYYLLKDSHQIKMVAIFRLLNGPVAMIPCASLNFYERCEDCPNEALCGVNRLMEEVRDSTLKVLNEKTLYQLTFGQNPIS